MTGPVAQSFEHSRPETAGRKTMSVWNDKPTALLTSGRTILKQRRNLTSKIAELLRGTRNPATAAVQP